jgi:hypothetical protein
VPGCWCMLMKDTLSGSHSRRLKGDGFCCIHTPHKKHFHELHQYKNVQDTLSEDTFLLERNKASDAGDFFILFSTLKVAVAKVPPRCAIVDEVAGKNISDLIGLVRSTSKPCHHHRLTMEEFFNLLRLRVLGMFVHS